MEAKVFCLSVYERVRILRGKRYERRRATVSSCGFEFSLGDFEYAGACRFCVSSISGLQVEREVRI
ncbi:MAG: hypothetical protein AM326_03355 [Candidatus Thorarchaeota archaeon SMTZ-45]|nr:MAG: hypothetical protein AM326_03355 [Candidatus Thorarchaeota archaeon SMTZ-45]